MKKILSVFLSVLMLIGMFSTVVLADGKPVITAEPQDVRIRNGEDAVFTVEASGEDLSYQWYCIDMWETWDIDDGDFYEGSNTPVLTVKSALTDCYYNGDIYYCIVSNAEGEVESRHAAYYVDHLDEDGDHVCDLEHCGRPFNFNDIPNNDPWYAGAVNQCQYYGIFEGDLERNFNPDQGITRAEVVIVLMRFMNKVTGMEGDPVEDLNALSQEEFDEIIQTVVEMNGFVDEVPTFNDIEGKWYERAVVMAAAAGWINGYLDGSFAGDQEISRQEIAGLLYRFFDSISSELPAGFFGEAVEAFADAETVAPWAKDYVEWSRTVGLFRGDENGNFNPNNECTRAEIAVLCYRTGWLT